MKLINGGPPALPGSCYKCGSGTRKRYIDLETDVEFHGAMYLCDECITEAATLLGMATEAKVSDLTFELLSAREEIARIEAEKLAVEKATSGFADVRDYFDTLARSAGDELVESPEVRPGKERVASGKKGSAESSDDEGVDELRTSHSIGPSI